MSSQFILCKPFQEKQENKSFACSVCIQIQPVKYCSVCQTGKYLDTGKQRSVPFIQQTLKRKTSGKLRLIASDIYHQTLSYYLPLY